MYINNTNTPPTIINSIFYSSSNQYLIKIKKILENKVFCANFTMIFALINDYYLLKINNHEGLLYLSKNTISELLSYSNLINSKLTMLRTIDFLSYYRKLLCYVVDKPDFTFSQCTPLIKDVCSLKNDVYSYCMLDFIRLNSITLLKDILEYKNNIQ